MVYSMESTKNLPTQKIPVSVGVFAYNEAANIGVLLDALLGQKLNIAAITEIIVVSSASTDGTDEIVKSYASGDQRIRLIAEATRNGKSAAINHFLAEAKAPVCVIESADTIPAPDTIELLVAPYVDEAVGMTGGKPIPVNDPGSFMGYAVHLLWRLHHRMALLQPKLGEMVSFRRVFDAIPAESAVDEASIESIIRQKGLQLRYIPRAIIHNKGPEILSDFIKQRRRIQAGHLWLKQNQQYRVSSQDGSLMLRLFADEFFGDIKKIPSLIGVVLVEIYSRILGWYDFTILKKNPFKWDIAQSTKNLES